MIIVSTSEAETHFADLLKKVNTGKKVLITQDDMPVAMMTPVSDQERQAVKTTIEVLKRLGEGSTLQDLNLKEMIEEGRQ